MFRKGRIPYRPYDYMYDPLFTVSGPVDYYKAVTIAKMSSVKFQLCPIFANIFSDLPNRPRVQLVQRRQIPIISYPAKLDDSKKFAADPMMNRSVDVTGADRAKFFCSIVNLPQKDFVGAEDKISKFTSGNVTENTEGGTQNITAEVQTIYRDSSAQTTPWQPPYKVIGAGEPEILKLEFLKWGSGLPAGMHEVKLIERSRIKRAWEKSMRPDINDENTMKRFRDYVLALEKDERTYREKETQEIQELRLCLLEEMLEEIHENCHKRTQNKLERYIQTEEKKKIAKLEKIRIETARELRKLALKENAVK